MANLSITNNTGYLLLSGGESKTITKPFAVQYVNSNTIELSSDTDRLNNCRINFGRYDIILFDGVAQNNIEQLYMNLYLNSVDEISVDLSVGGEPVTVQNPVPDDSDSVYINNIDFTCSDFTNWTGQPEDLFKSPFSESIVNSTSDNPKQITLCFNRTVKALQVGLGENNGGDFSNVKISLLGSGGAERSIYNKSTDDTKKTSLNVEFENEVFNSILIEFFTSDTVSLSNIIIFKARYDTAQIQGVDDLGNLKTAGVSRIGSLNVKLQEYQGDAFGRLRVSEPFTIFDSSLTTEESDTLFWSELINGTALTTYNQLTSSKTLNVGQNGDYVVRQTKQRFKYQPGKSHEVLITGHLPTSTNIRKRCGLLDYDNKGLATITNTPQNGIFFENDGGVLSWNIVNNGVVTEKVAQSLWNIDICDGNGVSGFNLDINSTNIFFTDLEWLGVGAVRCGFVSNDGTIIIAHQFQHASIGFSDVYMRTANLPVSYEIIATGATGGGEMKAICSSVISEGGFNPKGVLRGLEMPSAGVLVTGGDKETLIGIRLKEDEFEYSIEINSISTLAESSGDGKWQILFNPTLDGVPVWSDVADSVIQQSVSNIGVLDEGIVIANGLYSSDNDASSADIENSLKIGKDLLGNRDEIWLIIESFSTERMHGTINLRELI